MRRRKSFSLSQAALTSVACVSLLVIIGVGVSRSDPDAARRRALEADDRAWQEKGSLVTEEDKLEYTRHASRYKKEFGKNPPSWTGEPR